MFEENREQDERNASNQIRFRIKEKEEIKPKKKKKNTIIDENEQLSNIRAKRTPNEGMVVHNNKETAATIDSRERTNPSSTSSHDLSKNQCCRVIGQWWSWI